MATALSIIPGIGQLYNKQYVKGIAFLILTGAFFGVFADLLNMGLWGLFTLGEKIPRDHSIFLMVEGILAVIVLVFGLGFYLYNLRDAYNNGLKRDTGERLSSVKEQYHNLIDNGFPYLIMSPGFLLLVFVVIFPILFVVLLAFTNYDLYHSPP
ncbi:MAG TPA: sugar ABC transporter permease, partial [Bacillus bacterium]|nr:sugar ABC transporter permease [Bacillus sp. (in: firmicutes)]